MGACMGPELALYIKALAGARVRVIKSPQMRKVASPASPIKEARDARGNNAVIIRRMKMLLCAALISPASGLPGRDRK